jgi:galactoside O-acetyltransferase
LNSFYNQEELNELGLKSVGKNVLVSRKASIYSPQLLSIGDNVRIDDFAVLSGEIVLGSYIHIAAFCALFGKAKIEMKDFSTLSSRVTIYSVSDDYSGNFMTNPTVPSIYTNVKQGKVILEKHVIIGASSVILPSVVIGEGTAVGSMCLVTKSLPEWQVCAGVPAIPIRERSRDLIKLENELIDSLHRKEKPK